MKLIEVEQLFGGERTVVYYISEERVDFRELVKLLSKDFSSRVEMRQIGVRDEAKLLADYGDCGKPVCCNTHLSAMPPVSMKMAKLQKASLDPTKISGRCGRLKCCLRYEYDNYVDTQRQLPKVGSRVVTRNGTMKVLNQQILAEQLLVETEDHRRMVIDASEVLSVLKPNQPAPKSNSETKRDSDTKSKTKATKTNPPPARTVGIQRNSPGPARKNAAEAENPRKTLTAAMRPPFRPMTLQLGHRPNPTGHRRKPARKATRREPSRLAKEKMALLAIKITEAEIDEENGARRKRTHSRSVHSAEFYTLSEK